VSGEPVRLKNPDLGLDTTAHPLKDVALMIVAAFAGRAQAQHWIVEKFLEAALPHDEYLYLRRRLMSRHDLLDIEHLDPMIGKLIEHWAETIDVPRPNREQRRAAARSESRHGTL
jgi:hypothetical protein